MNFRINLSSFYMELNEWHHMYAGFLLFYFGYDFGWMWLNILGLLLILDDMIQHAMQGVFITDWKRINTNTEFRVNNGYIRIGERAKVELPHSPLNKLYKSMVSKWKWMQKITQFLDNIFGNTDSK